MEIIPGKVLSNNILDLILPQELGIIENYIPYLQCFKCRDVMTDPKTCNSCNVNVCTQCKSCRHELGQSRYINILLDSILFTCKYNCGSPKIKYSELKTHLAKCKPASSEFNQESKSTQSLSEAIIPNPFSLRTDHDFLIKPIEGICKVKCPNCNQVFSTKDEYTAHFKCCDDQIKKNQDPFILIQVFVKNHQEIFSRFRFLMKEKIKENHTIAIQHLNKLTSNLHDKSEGISNRHKKIFKLNSGQSLDEDEELLQLIEQENKLIEYKAKLLTEFKFKQNELKSLMEQKEKQVTQEISEYRDLLTTLETEERWAKETLEGAILISDCKEKCSKCGNEDLNTKKYLCLLCRDKFCLDKCIKQCKNINCNKYLCLRDAVDCKLCRKVNYCEDCLKKCFYQGCSNKFCPECYKKNEHQTRNSNINCKFFTCENDQESDCLMTSLFCGKCEKRLCNRCLMNDKDHWQFYKLN